MVRTGCVFCALLTAALGVRADDRALLPDDLFAARDIRWRAVGMDMSGHEYREARRSNRRLAGELLKQSIQGVGLSSAGGTVLGSALGAAAGGAELMLNESETMALQVQDPADGDRSVLFRLRLDWR